MNAKRIRGEGVGATGVVESVDHDLDRIVGEHILPARHASANLRRFTVPGHEYGVKIVLVVGEVDVGLLRRLGAVRRLAHDEACHLHHFSGYPGAGLHLFEIGERGRGVDAGNLDGGRGEGERRQRDHRDGKQRKRPDVRSEPGNERHSKL